MALAYRRALLKLAGVGWGGGLGGGLHYLGVVARAL